MSQQESSQRELQVTFEKLARQLTALQQVQRRQRSWAVGSLLVMLSIVALGAAVKITGGELELWPDAVTADPKSSHSLKLIGTDSGGAQRSIVLQNKSIDGTSYRLDIRAGATDLLTVKSDGKVGIGTTGPGAELEVAGQVKITGGTPAAGKVLTSDAAGLATWETNGLSTTGNSNTFAADTDANEAASKLLFEVDGTNRMTITGDDTKDWGDLSTAAFVRLKSV
ncbi:hypothetical protein JYT15_01110, partial [Acidimicrobium ferrooxidans]|nr:hypothetical protein [Acidimicrobium ferrooxidans]